MGKYITSAQVIVYTGTALTTAEIDEMISDIEGEVEEELEAEGGEEDTTSKLLKRAVECLLKAVILERGILDSTYVKSLPSGPTFEGLSIADLRNEAAKKIVSYLKKHGGVYTSSDVAIDETIVRADHEMPDGNLDQSKVKEYHDRASDTGNQDSDFEGV